MRYHNITQDDMNNGDGLRVVLWVAGCEHHCKGCQNPVTWNPDDGLVFDKRAFNEIMKALEKPYVAGITFSGGDPLHPQNRGAVFSIILEGAQLFGMMGNTMLGGGEAGREAVLPLENHTEWMDTLAYKVRAGLTGGSQDSIANGVREGMYDATARQNELLKEQNELLRQIASKDFTAEITTDSFTKAMNRKNQRDGKTIIPVTT